MLRVATNQHLVARGHLTAGTPRRGCALTPVSADSVKLERKLAADVRRGEHLTQVLLGAVALPVTLITMALILFADSLTPYAIPVTICSLGSVLWRLHRNDKLRGQLREARARVKSLASADPLELARQQAPHALNRPQAGRVDYPQYAVLCDRPAPDTARVVLVCYEPDPNVLGAWIAEVEDSREIAVDPNQDLEQLAELAEARGQLQAQAAELEAAALARWSKLKDQLEEAARVRQLEIDAELERARVAEELVDGLGGHQQAVI